MNHILCFFGFHNPEIVAQYGKGYPPVFGLWRCACGKREFERKAPPHPEPPKPWAPPTPPTPPPLRDLAEWKIW